MILGNFLLYKETIKVLMPLLLFLAMLNIYVLVI